MNIGFENHVSNECYGVFEQNIPCNRYKWNANNADDFLSNMNDQFSTSLLYSIIDRLDSEENISETMIDNCIDDISKIFDHSAKAHTMYNSNKHSNNLMYNNKNTCTNQWYDLECINKKKEFDFALKMYNESGNLNDRLNMCNIRNSYRKLCRQKRNKHQIIASQKLLELSKVNPRQFWKKIRSNGKNKIGSCDFNDYFKKQYDVDIRKLGEEQERIIGQHEKSGAVITDEFLDKDLTMIELEKAIQTLKTNKSPGYDQIINEFLKFNTPLFNKALVKIFNAIFHSGHFPTGWSIGEIVPIHKKGDLNNAENYRGITLLSCLGKLFTSILNNRLKEWSENNDIINQFQYGFRTQRSTVDAIYILQGIIDIFIHTSKPMYASFVDLKKAFDNTHQKALWYKMHVNNISTKVVNIIKDMYSKMKLCVKNVRRFTQCNQAGHDSITGVFQNDVFQNVLQNDVLQNDVPQNYECFFTSKNGVFQGESLSPFLFSIFLNDIDNYMKLQKQTGIDLQDLFITMILFADDMVILSESIKGLQVGLDRLEEYCDSWGVTVNSDKTKCIVFRKGGKVSLHKWKFKNQTIETVTHFKYLGFVLGGSGKFKKGVENLTNQGYRAMFNLKSILHNYPELMTDTKLHLFDTLINPVISYSCEVWGFSEAKQLETLHLQYLKLLLGVRKTTPTCIVYKETKRYPLILQRYFRILKFWLKILKTDAENPIRKVYNNLFNITIEDPHAVNWVSSVKKLLFENGFGYIWVHQYVDDQKVFLKVFKQRVLDIFGQNNEETISKLSTNRLYIHLSCESSCYLEFIKEKYIRTAISKFRMGSHNLNVERGKWAKLKYEDRLCSCCHDIEDEYHVAIICPRYEDLRKQYIPK